MALKKRTVVSPAAGAVSLPSLMADLPGTRRLEEVPLDKLSSAPADWNFYAPLPDDKLLELIERASGPTTCSTPLWSGSSRTAR